MTKKQNPATNEGKRGNDSDKYNSNSSRDQRQRILRYLRNHKKLTTLQARKELDVLHPAGRVQELRAEGHDIVTHWREDSLSDGRKHRVAEYVLLTSREVTA